MSLRRRSFLVKLTAAAILFGAVLPNATFVDHWPVFSPGHHDEAAATEADAQAHAAHCHTGPSKCSNEQALVGSWWIGDGPLRISLSAPSHAIELQGERMVAGPLLPVLTPPP